jgi:hypothetical protein
LIRGLPRCASSQRAKARPLDQPWQKCRLASHERATQPAFWARRESAVQQWS